MFSTGEGTCFFAELRVDMEVIVTYSGGYRIYFFEEIVSNRVFLHRNFNASFTL